MADFMTTPFHNDPFAVIWMAFKNLYPDKDCFVRWCGRLGLHDGKLVDGFTDFDKTTGEMFVVVDANLTVVEAMDVFVHELAHVAVGLNHGHDEVWENAFDRILAEHDRLVNIMFPDSVEVSKGGDENEG